MAASAEGIWNQHSMMRTTIAPSMDSTNTNSGSSSASASISANDFLTLLVTEMKKQDPTAQTDPNEYINQLVQVNSLEQLISINQTLSADSSAPANNSSGASRDARAFADETSLKVPTAPQPHVAVRPPESTPESVVRGNLTVPPVNSAAMRVAQALGNH